MRVKIGVSRGGSEGEGLEKQRSHNSISRAVKRVS